MTENKSFIKWPQELTAEQEKDRDKHEYAMYLDSLWEDFRISRHPVVLATFVRAGGDIGDQETRDLIADLLETLKPKHTRAHSQKQTDFYIATKEVMRENPTVSRNEAFRIMTGKKEGDDLKTEQARYAAGAKLLGENKKSPKV
jgi:hypothetical protein